jgi:hypothetical protein
MVIPMVGRTTHGGADPGDSDLGSFTGSQLVDTAIRLYADYADTLSLTHVLAVADDCRRDLAGAPEEDLPELVERLARVRLDELLQGRDGQVSGVD